ncbi:DNA repair protein RecN [Phycicoccus sp. SLBN-51]|uniref:DNA repair protein RecN n=1 Tax=Phycicoccus sp. SLBN-51 TaxID=2768447 RepID=UPI00114F5577|nr:DNA repair protein RecN [Phycicoccus sp. SLBN-51]TQJ51095.1 DNA replication and repair protein RecN [Phycicoccus sp. SLBN-51]
MLQEIRIQNLGVIDDAVLDLHPGLNVVSGETGAGKTMVVSGLGLLLGARADAGLVRAGARSAAVEGVVDLPADHPAAARAAEAGADTDDGLVLLRTVSAEGRSRAHVGGRTAPVGVLAEIGEHLVAVHGQADQWRLRQSDQHRALLDQYAGEPVAAALSRYQELFDEHDRVRRELAELTEAARDRAREVEILQVGLEQIEALDPQPGEDAELRVEDERLSHAEGLRTGAETARALLAGAEEEYAAEPAPSVIGAIADARSAVSGLLEHDPALRELDRRLAELGYLAADLGADLSSYVTDIELDPARLAWVQQRRADLSGLMRKYGDSVDEVLEWGRSAAARLDVLLNAEDTLAELGARLQTVRAELGEAAAALTQTRRDAATGLATAVTGELAHLAMGKAVVEVAVTDRPAEEGLVVPGREQPVRFGRHGVDDVEIMLAANPGAPARSVAKAASGGELSRVMLALEVVTGARGSGEVPTFVFDEVDAGVGGRAALDIGARLAALAQHAQVIVVTHLAQVAAFADRHLVVTKSSDGHVTSSGVVQVDDDERLRELARMMAGVDTDSAMEHARELLAQAGERREATARA